MMIEWKGYLIVETIKNNWKIIMNYRGIYEGLKDTKIQFIDSGKVPEKQFEFFVRGDHSRNNKYVLWMCKQYVVDSSRPQHIIDVVRAFNGLVDQRKIIKEDSDIYQYTLEEAEKKINDIAEQEQSSKVDTAKALNVVFENDRAIVVAITSHADAFKIGKSLRSKEHTDGPWCIGYKSDQWWKDYFESGNRFYYIVIKATGGKYMIQVPARPEGLEKDISSIVVWDENDKRLNYVKFKKKLGF